MAGHDKPALSDDEMRSALQNTIGTPRLREMAKGAKKVCILFDDIPKPTPTSRIIDADRPVTPFEHGLRDFREGPAWSRDGHFAEWVRLVERAPDEEVEQRAAARKEQGYSIHFHVWTAAEIHELFQRMGDVLPYAVEILCLFQGKGEVVVVARRQL